MIVWRRMWWSCKAKYNSTTTSNELHFVIALIELFEANVTKVQSVLQPRSAPLVPLVCSTIFAKRSWRFWAQELENV